MINYLKADLFRIFKERKLTVSLGILLLLSLLSALLYKESPDIENTTSLLQLISQFITLFFIVPANIFLGEDFTNRTINNVVIKQRNRRMLFFYKVSATVLFNLIYIFIAYFSSGLFRFLLKGKVDFSLILQTFITQIPVLFCISLLITLIFIVTKRVGQAYLTYILLSLVFDNLCRLLSSNLLNKDFSTDYLLFLSLQKGLDVSSMTISVSLVFTLIYVIVSYYIFNHKELK